MDKENKVGRPPMYKSAEELQEKFNEYLETETNLTVTGLALFLGFESRQSFYDYEKKEEFTYTIKRARTFIEKEYEELLRKGNAGGAIFALKNMGWHDKQLIDHTIETTSPIKIVIERNGKGNKV